MPAATGWPGSAPGWSTSMWPARQQTVRRQMAQGRTVQCSAGLPRDPSPRRNPRCCKRWRGSLLRLSQCCVARSTLAALLEAYLGRRSAAQVLAGRLRRETGETLRAVLLYGDLRGFTELSETMAPEAVVGALGAWFDRIAGAVHAFGGEVLKFIGDGVLAIFPIGERDPSAASDAALRAVAAARAGMAHLDAARG